MQLATVFVTAAQPLSNTQTAVIAIGVRSRAHKLADPTRRRVESSQVAADLGSAIFNVHHG
jgi:hypothetical protein